MKRKIRKRPGTQRQKILAAVANGEFKTARGVAQGFDSALPSAVVYLKGFLDLHRPKQEPSRLALEYARGLCESFMELVVKRDWDGIRAIAEAAESPPYGRHRLYDQLLLLRDMKITFRRLKEILGYTGDDRYLWRLVDDVRMTPLPEKRGPKKAD